MIISAPLPISSILTPEMSPRVAQAVRTTCERAESLKADGYRFERRPKTTVWECHKPVKVNRKTGEITEFEPYVLEIQDGAATCSCGGFYYYNHCKHERALRTAISEALELLIGGEL
jgi:hypothetical protein